MDMRKNIDERFKPIYEAAIELGRKVGVEEKMPQITGGQKGRANNPAADVEEYYFRNVVIPFVDHIIQLLNEKFDSKQCIHIM